MIPFASQRGYGQDLATHLLNTSENEELALIDVRGAIARDLHGAFAEWEAQAHALTKCTNYLYSMSINPDPAQDPLTRAQYMDYVARAEERLGLSEQPRAIVFHVKNGRAHAHVVWSRIDAENGNAVQLSFDHRTLMMVTKEFARAHNLTLPKGYEQRTEKSRQKTLYDNVQENETGITRAERVAHVTQAWQSSDTPAAFVKALEEAGYILATGKRDYVLVDIYGHMNALPRLIDDKQVRIKHVREFLANDYPKKALPTVEEARAAAANHLKQLGDHMRAEDAAELRAELAEAQVTRREGLQKEQAGFIARHLDERLGLAAHHAQMRAAIRSAYLAEVKRVRLERYQRRPQGLAAFLGKLSGVNAIRHKLHRWQDKKRYHQYVRIKEITRARQAQETARLAQRHKLQRLDFERKLRALAALEKRETKSLESKLKREVRQNKHAVYEHLPPITATRPAREEFENAFDEATVQGRARKTLPIKLSDEFERAASDEGDDDETDSSEGLPNEMKKRKRRRRRERERRKQKEKDKRKDKDIDRERW